MLENRMVLDEELYIENDVEEYLEYLSQKEDERYEDEIFEKIIMEGK